MSHGHRWALSLYAVMLATALAYGSTRALFTSQESVEKEIARLIDGSRSSIDMALFHLSSPPLEEAIRRARQRGVRIRAILDARQAMGDQNEGRGAAFSDGDVRRLDGKFGGGRGVMHHKFALFDGKLVVTGSFNWTPGAEHVNYENALFIDDPDTVASFRREFETLWARASPFSQDRVSENSQKLNRHHSRKKFSLTRKLKKFKTARLKKTRLRQKKR